MLWPRLAPWLPLLLGLVLALLPGPARAQDPVAPDEGTATVLSTFVGRDGVTFAQLAAGREGVGFLLYHLEERGPERPSLVVRLVKNAALEGGARAEAFQAPEGLDHVPVTLLDGDVRIDSPEPPAIVMEAADGWWVRDGTINYNLDVRVYGLVRALWGIELVPEDAARMGPDRHLASLSIRDPDGEGLPAWELRSLVPPFARRGYYRASYAERKCDSPLRIDPGVTPLWPFVDRDGGLASFLQPTPGALRPPILMDWRAGRIRSFGELVTVRHQNCSYSFYSITPVVSGEVNDANFETPFAFYDFSGEGEGHPNYIIRTERFPAHDPFSQNVYVDSESHLDGTRPVPRDLNILRVSWRNDVGDGRWDYALQLMGFHPYVFETPVAGGEVTITAPSYDAFPAWVVEQPWPIVGFVDAGAGSYPSSEGIYDWGAAAIELGYAFGWTPRPNLEAYEDIRQGFRGEYRYRDALAPELYLSPVDHQLHLVGAVGGVWNLGGGRSLRVANLFGGAHLDSWELIEPGPDGEPVATARLVDLGGYLLLVTEEGAVLRRASVEPALFTLAPPSDAASWRAFRDRVEPYEALENDPLALRSWIDRFPGATLAAEGVAVDEFRVVQGELRFSLTVPDDASWGGDLALPALAELPPGRHVVAYDRSTASWRALPRTAARLRAELAPTSVGAWQATRLQVRLRNDGSLHHEGEARLLLGDEVVATWPDLVVPGLGSVEETVAWSSGAAGRLDAVLELGEERYPLGSLTIGEVARPPAEELFVLSIASAGLGPVAVLLGLVGALGLWGLWRAWASP